MYSSDLSKLPVDATWSSLLMHAKRSLLKSLLFLRTSHVTSSPVPKPLVAHCLHCGIACSDKAQSTSNVVVISMPMLSPTMTEGSLLSWMKSTGEQVEPYDLLFELETESLTEEAYRVGDFEGVIPTQHSGLR